MFLRVPFHCSSTVRPELRIRALSLTTLEEPIEWSRISPYIAGGWWDLAIPMVVLKWQSTCDGDVTSRVQASRQPSVPHDVSLARRDLSPVARTQQSFGGALPHGFRPCVARHHLISSNAVRCAGTKSRWRARVISEVSLSSTSLMCTDQFWEKACIDISRTRRHW